MFETYTGEILARLQNLENTMPRFKPEDNEDIKSKCCHLGFLQTREQIIHVFNVHGADVEIFDATFPANEELGEPDEPQYGFLMREHEKGYPCNALTKNGCGFGQDEKPWSCKRHPTYKRPLITTCSYEFGKDGKYISGQCNRCSNG